MRHPVRALLIGGVFILTGIVYWLVSYEPAGAAALLALGIAMGLMSYALASAAPDLGVDEPEPGMRSPSAGHGDRELGG